MRNVCPPQIARPFFLLMTALIGVPAFAQMDFSGDWAPVQDEDNTGNPYTGEFIGIPMSHAGALRAQAWNASLYTLPEWQCRPHGAMYISRGPSQVRIWKEVDPDSREITAFHAEWLRSIDNPYYMDGRPRPSKYAPHTWGGFSTAEFIGDMLKITTTNLKEDYYRRNGVPSSDQATLTQYWIRRGDILTWVTIANDPIYLTEPMIRASEYRLNLAMQIPPYPCTVVEEVDRPSGVVPHYLPGANPFITDFGKKYNIPMEANQGGAATMYPELPRKIVAERNGAAAKNGPPAPRPRSNMGNINQRRKGWLRLGWWRASTPALCVLAGIALAQQRPQPGPDANGIEIVPVRGNIYLLAGAGANITLSVGKDGVFMVDTGKADMADKVFAAIQRLSTDLNTFARPYTREDPHAGGSGTILSSYTPPKPIRYIANTSIFPDHSAGNPRLAELGKTFTGGNVSGDVANASEGAAVLAHENVLQRLSDAKMPFKGLPTETYFGNVMKLSHFFNGEGVELIHIPAASTDGDSIVHFRTSDVISAGDILTHESYPVIDMQKGGTVQGVLAGLNRLLDMMVAEFRSEGGTFVIPGHGRVCDTADVAYYRDMTTIIRDRVQDMIKKGMTIEQVKAAKPTEDWDGRFGSTTGPWTTDMFIEAVYKSLAAKK